MHPDMFSSISPMSCWKSRSSKRSAIALARGMERAFDDLDFQHDIGEIELNMSGCMNACGHHHVGNIGILGVDKDGEEWYQVSIGGAQGNASSLGKVIGRSFTFAQTPEVVGRLLEVYVRERFDGERFIDTVRRIGHEPFKNHVYAAPVADDAALAGAEYRLLAAGAPHNTPLYATGV